MQTFLPFADFNQSAKSLDMRRLGKQRVEAKQIYLSLTSPGYGWSNHPAVKMWKGYEKALLKYGVSICNEWRNREYKDTLLDWFMFELANFHSMPDNFPAWMGNNEFHISHQSNLIRKLPDYYKPKFPNIPADLPYIWPVN